MIAGRRVRMRAGDAGNTAIDEISERLLLARRLGVEIDEDDVRPLLELAGRYLVIDGAVNLATCANVPVGNGGVCMGVIV